MLTRIGSFVTVGPDSPLVIAGVPPATYHLSLGLASAAVSVTAGSVATVDLP